MASPARAGLARGTRRELILAAATRLFHQSGFHAIGMDDIGAAAGITGPGVYRHFKSKEDILESLMERVANAFEQGVVRASMEAQTPEETLELLVIYHVRIVLDDPELVTVYFREAHNLRADARLRRRSRRRVYIRHWLEALGEARNELSLDDQRFIVNATIGLVNTLSGVPNRASRRAHAEQLATHMALAALYAAVPTAEAGSRGHSR